MSCNQLLPCCGLSSCGGSSSRFKCIKLIYFILRCQVGTFSHNPTPRTRRLRALFELSVGWATQVQICPKWDRKGKLKLSFPIPNTSPKICNWTESSEQQWERVSGLFQDLWRFKVQLSPSPKGMSGDQLITLGSSALEVSMWLFIALLLVAGGIKLSQCWRWENPIKNQQDQ